MTDLADLDTQFHFHPQTDPRALEAGGPVIMASGSGVRVTGDDGREYLEGMASLWCASLGFSERRLAEAAYKQMQTLPTYHTFNRRSNAPCIELSEALAGIAPFASAHISYVNSGSEAVDSMVKAAWLYQSARGLPNKRKIISRERAYHGSTVLGASLCGLPHVRGAFALEDAGILFAAAPDYYARADAEQSEADFVDMLLAELEALIEREGAETIAAMIVEPVMGAGGVVIAPPAYLPRVAELMRRNDILLLSDEVICGFGRTGTWFGCESTGFVPDMMSAAKGITSGYLPLGAVFYSDPVYQVVADEARRLGIYGHGFTYAGHPVTCAVALETQRIYREIDILGRVNAMAPVFARELAQAAQHPLVAEVRSLGLIGAVELRRSAAGAPLAPAVVEAAFEQGLIVRVLGNAVAFCPPLIVDEGELAEMFLRFRAALDRVKEVQ